MASQITGVSSVCSTVCSGADQRKHQSSASLAFVRGLHRWPVDSPHTGPVTRKMFPFDDVIMWQQGSDCPNSRRMVSIYIIHWWYYCDSTDVTHPSPFNIMLHPTDRRNTQCWSYHDCFSYGHIGRRIPLLRSCSYLTRSIKAQRRHITS